MIPAGSRLVRLFDPTDFGATAVAFRFAGPFKRFDHHRRFSRGKPVDPARGIYYAAYDFDGCLVEAFGDTDIVECGERRVARPGVTRDLRLLDLRGDGSWRAGSVAALSQN